jgi:hypothetical protein
MESVEGVLVLKDRAWRHLQLKGLVLSINICWWLALWLGMFFFGAVFPNSFRNEHFVNVECKYLRYKLMRTSYFQSLVYSPVRMYSNPFQTLACTPLNKASLSNDCQGKIEADCNLSAWQTDIMHTCCQHSFDNRCSYRGMVITSLLLTFVR